MHLACRGLSFALFFGAVVAMSPALAQSPSKATDGNGSHLDMLIAKHAAAHDVPEALVRRVIKRESRGNARAISKGNYGLMQIRLGTARGLGYRGNAAGLLDADTNMTYAVKYLAGAYRVAGGNQDRAVSYYASGYYYHAKRKGMAMPGATIVAAAPVAEAAAASPATTTGQASAATIDEGDDSMPDAAPAESVANGDAAVVSSH